MRRRKRSQSRFIKNKNAPRPKRAGCCCFWGKPKELFPKIGEVLRPYFGEGDRVEMAKADLKLLEAAEKVTKPFYKK